MSEEIVKDKAAWEVERERVTQRDALIVKGIEEGINDIAEKYAMSMCHDHPGMVYPRMNHVVFSEVKACIVAACLESIQRKGCIY